MTRESGVRHTVRTFLSSFELCVCAVQGKMDKHHTSVTNSSLPQTSLPLSLRPSLSALPSTTSPPSPSSAPSSEEFFKSKETASAAAAWGTSLAGSALQSYGVGALLNATGTLSYKGAAYLGGLIFAASSAPSFIAQIFTEKRPLDTVAVGALARVFETVGLSMFLTYWGTRTNPFS
ncbi:hypothetical protein KCU83_g604, partial [Aureobasidium melanogenum]